MTGAIPLPRSGHASSSRHVLESGRVPRNRPGTVLPGSGHEARPRLHSPASRIPGGRRAVSGGYLADLLDERDPLGVGRRSGVTLSVVTPDSLMAASRSATGLSARSVRSRRAATRRHQCGGLVLAPARYASWMRGPPAQPEPRPQLVVEVVALVPVRAHPADVQREHRAGPGPGTPTTSAPMASGAAPPRPAGRATGRVGPGRRRAAPAQAARPPSPGSRRSAASPRRARPPARRSSARAPRP